MKVLRLVIYEGTEKSVEAQLAGSLAQGEHPFGRDMTVTVVPLGSMPDSLALIMPKVEFNASGALEETEEGTPL